MEIERVTRIDVYRALNVIQGNVKVANPHGGGDFGANRYRGKIGSGKVIAPKEPGSP